MQIIRHGDRQYPSEAQQMHRPPATLYYRGNLKACLANKRVAIVGSRRMSPYGKQVTNMMAKPLAERGVTIVSGLAIGIDGEAHRAALAAGGRCLAVLPSPIDGIVPASNRRLADQIVQQGGALISQYPPGSDIHKGNFVARNELVAALSTVLLITEAAAGSGSLHTANFAVHMQAEVMAVPGNITSPLSAGTNNLIATGQAAAASSVRDVLLAVGLREGYSSSPKGSTPEEQQLIDVLLQGICDGEALLQASGQSVAQFNQTLTMLEITGKIMPLGANRWGLP